MGNCISSAVGGLGVVLLIHGADTMELILFTFMIISIDRKPPQELFAVWSTISGTFIKKCMHACVWITLCFHVLAFSAL